MMLRGQGDSPVRICEPCKKLEEAARFEMRYGHKSRAEKSGSKLTVKSEDEVLNQILGSEGKLSLSSRSASASDKHSRAQKSASSASFSSFHNVSSSNDGEDVFESLTHGQGVDVSDMVTVTPDELHQQALEEKKKYRILKAEGKAEEALRAFKKGKELERQAGALNLSLRKERRKALSSSRTHEIPSVKDDSKESTGENKALKSKGKDDFASELRELGWSDLDLHAADKRPATMTLEGELSTLIGELSQKTNRNEIHGIDKSQVIAHKKRALELKRSGKLAEAKEELKKAKVLEKQIEEQELLGDDDEDSDEEISALLRSFNANKNENLSSADYMDHDLDFGNLLGLTDDIGGDVNLEVTEEDLDDPEMSDALKSLGWTEDAEELGSHYTPNSEALLNEIQSLKKEALHQKRAGNTGEALSLLKKAKLLEKDLDGSETKEANSAHISVMEFEGEPMNSSNLDVLNVAEQKDHKPSKRASKSKLMVQKELLVLKKRALALRREGKMDEAEEELKKGEVLEKQLEEMNSAPPITQTTFDNKKIENTVSIHIGDEGEGEVTDQDMTDPTYISILKNLGWKDDNDRDERLMPSEEEETTAAQVTGIAASQTNTNVQEITSRKSKSEIQRELLGLKRKSLALRRQGEAEAAEEVLKMTKVLEAQLAETEAPMHSEEGPSESKGLMENVSNKLSVENSDSPFQLDSKSRTVETSSGAGSATVGRAIDIDGATEQRYISASRCVQANEAQNDGNSLQQDVLVHKRRALALKREGKLAEAKEELRQAKLLEKRMEEEKSQKHLEKVVEMNDSQPATESGDILGSNVSSVGKKEASPSSGSKSMSSRDRFKIQQECLSHKRQALKLRREGRTAEADAELELAKALEAQLEESGAQDSSSSSAAEPTSDTMVENLLDPQLLSALRAIGIRDANPAGPGPGPGVPESKQAASKVDKSVEERAELEEQIKAERMKAVNFKRSGKQAEALDALRRAKHFEKKLNSLNAE